MNRIRGKWAVALMAAATSFLLGRGAPLQAQQPVGTVQGRVVQTGTGQPVEAAQISVTGTQRGTVTNRDGTFRIESVPAGEREIRAQFIGYKSVNTVVTVQAGQAVTVNFELQQAPLDLEEIVVTGVAGQQVRAKLPFTVDRLTSASLPVPALDAGSMITAKAPGVHVAAPSGRPGAAPSVLLRGPTSINASGRSQDPLYIVDGVILSSSVVDIDAMDIESIEIVKGAAAASLYGSRAANGVIQITTQRGKQVADDQVRYTIRNEFGASDLPGRFNLTQHHQFAMTDNGMFLSATGTECDWIHCPSVKLAGQRALAGEAVSEWNTIMQEQWPGVTYDQVERFFRGGQYMTNSFSVAGRAGGTNYLVSYNRTDNEGIMPYQKGDLRHSFRLNIDQAVRPDITVSASAMYTRSAASNSDGNMFQLTRMPAGVDLMSPDPNVPNTIVIKPDPFNDNVNPLYTMSTTTAERERSRYLGSVTARWTPIAWFSLDTNVSFDRLDSKSSSFRPKNYVDIQGTPQGGSLSYSNSRTEGINASLTGQFTKQLGELNATTQIRYLIEKEDNAANNVGGSEFTADGVWTISNIPSDRISGGSSIQNERADGFFAITRLDYKDRYVLDLLARNDGSSLFGPDQRRHWYYRGGMAYRLSQEPWFRIPGVDELKLRYAIGTAGNRPSFSAQYETYSVSGGSIRPVTLGNKDLKPEFVTEQEMGIDALLYGRFSTELTYAKTKAEDQILSVPALAYTGFSSQWQNAGTLESNTWEASVTAQLVRTREFAWKARVNFDRTRQKITEIHVPAYQDGVSGQGLGNVFYYRKGEALGTFYGFKFAQSCAELPTDVDCGDFQVNDDGYLVYVGAAGSWKNGWDTYTDESGATQHWWGTAAPVTIRGATIRWGVPFQAEGNDPVTGERTTFLPLGQTLPKYTLSLANTFSWKGLALYGLFESVQGFHVYNQPLQWAVFQGYAGIMDEFDNPDESLKKPMGYYSALYGASGLQPSSAFVDDASFIKLRELSLSYRFTRDQLNALPLVRGLSGLTLSAVGRNVWTHTKYDGYDPDVGSTGGGVGSAVLARVDGYSYPNFRTLTLGVEINF